MNKHFRDAGYYLKRAGEHVKLGLKESVDRVESRLRELTGRETEPEPSRVDAVLEDVKASKRRAEGEARERLDDAREKLEDYRPAR